MTIVDEDVNNAPAPEADESALPVAQTETETGGGGTKEKPREQTTIPAASVRLRTDELCDAVGIEAKTVASAELFFDLMFITCVAKLNDAVQENLGFSQYLQYFFTIWYFWLNSTYYSSIFGEDDLFHKFYYLLYGVGVVTFAINIDGTYDTTAAMNFGLVAVSLKVLNVLVFVRTYVGLYFSSISPDSDQGSQISAVERLAMQKVLILTLREMTTGTIYLLGTSYFSDFREELFWGAVFCEPFLMVVLPMLTKDRSILTPPANHFIDRIESFLLIALGFNILSIVVEPADFDETPQLIVNVGMGFLIVFFVKLIHYDVEVVNTKDHALKRSPAYAFAWMTLSGMVAAGMTMMGSGTGSVVALASTCASTATADADESTLTASLGGKDIDDRRRSYVDEALVYRRVEDEEISDMATTEEPTAEPASEEVEDALEDDVNDSSCNVYDSNKSKELFAWGFGIIMIGEALYRVLHKPDYEEWRGAKFLYWFQFSCMLISGFAIIIIYEAFLVSSKVLLIWGFCLSLFLVLLNLLDEMIDAVNYSLQEKKKKKTDQATALINEDGNSAEKYVVKDENKEKDMHTHGWAAEGFFQGVTVRNDELIEDGVVQPREVHTSELFFDLMFAASISQLNGYLIEESIYLEEYIQYFVATYFFWMANTYYSSIFGNDDLFHKLFYAIFSLFIIYMAMFQSGGWAEDGYGYEYGLTAGSLRLMTMLVYVRCYYYLKKHFTDPSSEEGVKISKTELRAMNKMQFFIVRDFFGCLLWYFGAYYYESRGLAFSVASLVDVLSLIIFGAMDSKDLIRPPLEHFAERIEGFMLVVLGFAVDGIALAVDEADNPARSYTCALVGFLIVFFVKLLHFDCEVFDDSAHALSRQQENLGWGLLWMIMTSVTACGISLVGAGSEAVITEIQYGDEDIDSYYTQLYVGGLSCCLLSESGLRYCHTPVYEDFWGSKALYWTQMVIQVIAGILIPFLDDVIDTTNYTIIYYYAIIYGVIVVLNLVDEFIEMLYKDSEQPDIFDKTLQQLKTEMESKVVSKVVSKTQTPAG